MGSADSGGQPHEWPCTRRNLINHQRSLVRMVRPRRRSLVRMVRAMQEAPVLRRSGNARGATGTTTRVSFADFENTRISTRRGSGLEVRLKEKFVCGTQQLRSCYHGNKELMAPHGMDLLSRPPGQALLLQTGRDNPIQEEG